MYCASTGRQPFGSANVLSTLRAIQNDTPPAPAESNANVSEELSDLTMCLLEKLPEIAELILLETKEGTLRSRTFLNNVKFPKDAVKQREQELVSALLKNCAEDVDAKIRFWAQVRFGAGNC